MKPVLWEDLGGKGICKKKQCSVARIQRRLEKKRLNKQQKVKNNG
jgi:hypothetical protein